jgi:hypothetical protein
MSTWTDQRPLLREHDAAALLALKPTTLRRWRLEGKGPRFRKIGRAVRYHLDDLASFIDSSVRLSTSDTGADA